MRILIVEDEMKIRNGMAKLIMSHTDHTIVGEAKNGKEGLEMVLRFHPELVITDIRMPQMDGLEMIEELKSLGIGCHIIVLSGYSDFEYAQKALRFNVDDYLLKPLAPEDVIGMLEKIQKRLDQEEKSQAETTEGLMRALLLESHQPTNEEYQLIYKAGGFQKENPFYLLAGYLGNTNAYYINSLNDIFDKMRLNTDEENRIHYVLLENIQQLFCIFQGEWTEIELYEKLQRRLYLNISKDEQPVWAFVKMEFLEDLISKTKELYELQQAGMYLGYKKIITREMQTSAKLESFEYPKQLETKLRNAVCASSVEQIEKSAEDFVQKIRNGKWEPRQYRYIYGKILHFLENLIQDMDSAVHKAIQNMDIEKQIANAVTLGELEQSFYRVIQQIADACGKKDDIRNYVILRAINYIKEHYRENLSLEQLAVYLDITPEYLSTLFNKEMGVNFTVFLKQFRISHAKRLLRGSDKKIYEIAAEVGYHDPKYFNRVFKEETGVSPGDYRQQV